VGWETRSYGSPEGSGFRRGLRRVFGEGENPLSWALPLYTAWGIRVRVHLVFVIMIVVELLTSLSRNSIGTGFVAMGLAGLFVLVLLHEYGHCIACRRVGGTADQILMWPLGGLAYCLPPHNWKADLITTLGGPAVNVILWPVLGTILAVLIPGQLRGDALLFNPFDPGFAMGSVQLANGTAPMWLIALWWLYYTNAVLLLFNVLLPMYPMDSGRILHAILWSRLGHRRALEISVNVGLFMAVVVFIFGMTTNASHLTAVALFGGITCWIERRRLVMTDPIGGAYDFERGLSAQTREDERTKERRAKAAEQKRKEQEKEQAELDRILAKIAGSGMDSLTGAEKKWLARATERRRGG
jgi:stage IV sporulation protein FB